MPIGDFTMETIRSPLGAEYSDKNKSNAGRGISIIILEANEEIGADTISPRQQALLAQMERDSRTHLRGGIPREEAPHKGINKVAAVVPKQTPQPIMPKTIETPPLQQPQPEKTEVFLSNQAEKSETHMSADEILEQWRSGRSGKNTPKPSSEASAAEHLAEMYYYTGDNI